MSRRKYFISIVVVMVIFFNAAILSVSAQDSTKLLTLGEAITATLNNNKSLKLAKLVALPVLLF